MILIENNLKLRAIEYKDCSFLLEMINDPELENMVVGWSLPVSEHRQMEWINALKCDDMKYIIEIDGLALGMASVTNIDFKNSTANLNIKIKNGENKRKGIGTRTIRVLIRYCFDELNMNCLTANILEYNKPSIKLFEKCGFINEGILRSRVYKKASYHNLLSYSLLKDEYKK